MIYEWDENKRAINLKNHGIDFVDAVEIFSDRNRIETVDKRKDYGEERLQTIGHSLTMPGLLFVVYTYRDDNTKRRMISARTASKNERALYNSLKGQ